MVSGQSDTDRIARQLEVEGLATSPDVRSSQSRDFEIFSADRPPKQGVATRRSISRREHKEAEEGRIRARLATHLDRAGQAKTPAAQERAISEAAQEAETRQTLLGPNWNQWLGQEINRRRASGRLERGAWIGHVGDVQLLSDRIVWRNSSGIVVKKVNQHVRASIQTAGEVSRRPTLTRMALGSVLPGTALIPGLALQKTTDNRQLLFVLEHPEWVRFVELAPDFRGTAQQLATRVNQAAAKVGHDLDAAGVADLAGGPSYLEELKQLGELRDAGVLTEEEFATQKALVLSRRSGG